MKGHIPIHLLTFHGAALADSVGRAAVSIVGTDFHINGKSACKGRNWKGHLVEGLLLNTRLVQSIYDDLHPETVRRWVYQDTGKWDAEHNVSEFIAAIPEWKKHGLLALATNLRGGSPEGHSKSPPRDTGAFTPEGELRPDFMKRLLDAAERNGMVVILLRRHRPCRQGCEGLGLPPYSCSLRPNARETPERVRENPRYRQMPVINNEDDHEDFDKPENNVTVSIAGIVSWSWFDYRRKGEGIGEGYQYPPVNFGISSERKRGFFNL